MSGPLRDEFRNGRPCLNGWSLLPCPSTAEIFAQGGWDAVTFDMQHGLHDYATVLACLQATQRFDITPLVRPPSLDAGVIGKLLDSGAWGIICPMINTVELAQTLVQLCLYPPAGIRSHGPLRASSSYGGTAPYVTVANDLVVVLPQIETAEAVENLDAILDVPGVSGVYVGPSDLGFSMGLGPALDRREDQILAIFEKVIAAARSRNKLAAIHTGSSDYAASMIRMGFNFITVASDVGLLGRSSRQALAGVGAVTTPVEQRVGRASY